jgi:hypothetical protein
MPFNLPRILNAAIRKVDDNYIIVMHDDILIKKFDWMEWLVGYAQDFAVGAISGKIVDTADKILEFGGVIGLNGEAPPSSMFKGLPVSAPGDFKRALAVQNTSTVFSTLMMFTKDKFNEIGGFDERYNIFNFDVDFCLRLKAKGYLNVILPECQATHLNSGRRLLYHPKNSINNTIHNDKTLFMSQYAQIAEQGDPYYNPILLEKRDKILTNTIRTLMITKGTPYKIPRSPQVATVIPAAPSFAQPAPVPPVKLIYKWENPYTLISYIIPWYEQVPVSVFSLLAQTYPNIEIILYHDGPLTASATQYSTAFTDRRIKLFNTSKRYNDWGHTPRKEAIEKISPESAAVVFTGTDNYYLPSFTIELFSVLCQDAYMAATYCDMIHNEKNWNTVNTDLKYAYIDCGCFMVRPEVAKEFDWKNKVSWEDWAFIEKIINKYTSHAIKKVPRVLYIHN